MAFLSKKNDKETEGVESYITPTEIFLEMPEHWTGCKALLPLPAEFSPLFLVFFSYMSLIVDFIDVSLTMKPSLNILFTISVFLCTSNCSVEGLWYFHSF